MILKQRISNNYLKPILTGVFSVVLLAGYAQEGEKQQGEKPANELTNRFNPQEMDSIEIVRDYRPMLADAVKIRRSPDMNIDRKSLEIELRKIAAGMYFSRNKYKEPYHSPLPEKYPNSSRDNIDNNRIGIIAYRGREFERAASILKKVAPGDAFYQSSMIALGYIAQENGDKQGARDAFNKASEMNYDQDLKADALYNYAKSLYELDSIEVSLNPLQQFISMKYADLDPNSKNAESTETRMAQVLSGSSNFQAAVYLLESFQNREQKADEVYQKLTYYRGMEFYNERAFENSISMFMRSEKFPYDKTMAALATYWKAEAMYEVRKYSEAVDNFSKFLQLPEAKTTSVYNYANYALAYAAFRINRYAVAAQYFERFLAAEKGTLDESVRYDVIARLGDSYLSTRNYSRANEYYDQLIANNAPNQDYALFQHGIIQGLQGDNQAKLNTLKSVVEKYPSSNYADDVAFEIPYIYFTEGDYDTAIEGLQRMVEQYPRSSYVPRALVTIGLVQYNKDDNEAALATFQKVVKDYSKTSEASQALLSIENIYLDQGDATGYIQYATGTNITDLSVGEQGQPGISSWAYLVC
ncbi:tetratricopeptide repeat protein [Sphingobacterium daejeonense]|uniref:tetratricopeptide repeat protein n=1 Tax=Sphingobacterium daejeonense TaxID=371142 RepID=UPI0010C55B08|nr:tetratricopeptide repeat protein [Sphingobacterium daejeonense]VTP99544.1 tol-pal system protein YbgF [Sphingobacterium daejeonense]